MAQRSANPAALLPIGRSRTPNTTQSSRGLTVLALTFGDLLGTSFAAVCSLLALSRAGVALTPEHGLLMVLFVMFALTAYGLAGLYPGVGTNEVDELRLLSRATTGVWGVLLPTSLALRGSDDLWLGILAWLVALVAVPLAREGVRELASRSSWWGVPVVVLGVGDSGRGLVERLLDQPRSSLRPVALFDEDAEYPAGELRGVRIEGSNADCHSYYRRGVRHAVVAVPSLESTRVREVIAKRAGCFPNILILPELNGVASIHASAVQLGGNLGVRLRQGLNFRHNLLIKRAVDLVLLLPTGLLAALVVAVAAVAIRIVSPGNPFYSQVREGLGGRKFRMWKLRTMHVDAEDRLERYLEENPAARAEWVRSYKLSDDPRIIPGLGHFLRKSSLDELPQLWNIAKGDMSFVGPRPFPGYHLEAFDDAFRSLRRKVRPGLTGMWQVGARSDSDLQIQEEMDSYYIANWSPWMDIYVLTRTPWAVITGSGAR